jgi:hypothetical protein
MTVILASLDEWRFSMIDIRAHTKTDYADLPDIDSPAMEALDDSDWECLDEIGGLLIAKGVNDRFGITLLHSHFPVSDSEIMVEEPRPGERAFTLRPVEDHAAGADDRVAINLEFGSGRDDRALPMIGLEFIRSEALNGIAPVSDSDARVLRDVREVLERRDRLRRFGVGLLHDAIGLKESEVLLETCDLSTRALNCIAAGREDKRVRSGVETTWSWTAPAEAEAMDPRAIRTCRRQCTAVRVCFKAEDGSHQSQEGGHDPSGHDIGPD